MVASGAAVTPFGELLAAHRSAAGLTQDELAARASLSVDAVGLLERGGRSPRSRTVRALADALGLGPRERSAFQAAAARRPRPVPLRVPPDLPLRSTPFVGREAELARVAELLGRTDVRLLTLTGAPGAGKTRLALEAAAALAGGYRDGAAVVTLGPLAGPELVLPAVREALGLAEAVAEPALATVVAHCRGRRLLLVLDNFEHVLAAGPDVAELLAACPGVQLLVTSRAPLRLRAEHELAVPPLALPGAERDPAALLEASSVRLFLDRVAAAAPGFRLTAGTAGTVAAICRRLDGLPLALELAAPWIRLLTPEELLARLDRSLDLLVDGPRDLPERQRTMRAMLEWSCALLEPGPRALLRRLAVFAGSVPLDALERVSGPAGGREETLRQLSVLAGHGLVRRPAGGGREPRTAMLESVREYARELLVAAGELETAAGAHLDHYAELAARARSELQGAGQAAWLERLRGELDNIRAALGWAAARGPAEKGLRLAADLGPFWDYAGHRREGLAWLERLLPAAGAAAAGVRAAALHTAASLAWRVGSHDLAIARQRESLGLYRELRDANGVANATRGLGIALDTQGSFEESLRLFEEAVALLRELDDRRHLASALLNLGVGLARHGGDPERATALYEEALGLYRELGNALSMAHCLVNLGNRAKATGHLALAESRYREAAELARPLDSPFHLGVALVGLGDIARLGGDAVAAGERYREALRLFGAAGERQAVAVCLRFLGWFAWATGRPERAARLYGAGEALWPGAAAADGDEEEARLHAGAHAGLAQRLGPDAYLSARRAGARLTLEAALAEGLSAQQS